jgi:hypothetical protein
MLHERIKARATTPHDALQAVWMPTQDACSVGNAALSIIRPFCGLCGLCKRAIPRQSTSPWHSTIGQSTFPVDVQAVLQNSQITLLFLPTYAPWLNPIEKVWRKLKQEILHLHRYSSRWTDLQARVDAWLIQYDRPAPDLLSYVGLLRDSSVNVHYRPTLEFSLSL